MYYMYVCMYVCRGLWGRGVSRSISSPGVATTQRAGHGSFAFTFRKSITYRTDNILLYIVTLKVFSSFLIIKNIESCMYVCIYVL